MHCSICGGDLDVYPGKLGSDGKPYETCESIHRDRARYLADVSRPGKFENERSYVPYFYELSLDGHGEYVYEDCGHEDDCDCESQLAYIDFTIAPGDLALFPELVYKGHVRIAESETGFVYET